MDRRDKIELVVTITIVLGIFIAYAFTPLTTLVHEAGHQISCLHYGGTYETTGVVDGAYTTQCMLPTEETFTSMEILVISLSGIGMEILLALILILLGIFLTSSLGILGSLILINIFYKGLLGAYATDIAIASEVLPSAQVFQLPMTVVPCIFLGAVLVFMFTVRTIVEKQKRDFPFDDFDLQALERI